MPCYIKPAGLGYSGIMLRRVLSALPLLSQPSLHVTHYIPTYQSREEVNNQPIILSLHNYLLHDNL